MQQDYLDALASDSATPGGGSAAAVVAAMGAALVAMVSRITLRNAALSDRHPRAEALVERADGLRAALLEARAADEEAYAAVIRAQALPRTDDAAKAARTAAVQAALAGAAASPLSAAQLAVDVLDAALDAIGLDNPHVESDAATAAEFAAAAVAACAYNVRINHAYLRDARLVAEQAATLATLEGAAQSALERVRATQAKGRRTPQAAG